MRHQPEGGAIWRISIDIAKELHWVTAIDADGVVLLDRKLLNRPLDLAALAADLAALDGQVGIDVMGGIAGLAAAGNLSCFRSASVLASAAGIAPVLKQSGQTRFLSRAGGGNRGLKRVFYQSAFCSLARDDNRPFYPRKRREGKRYHQPVIALARRRVNVL